MIKTNTNNIIIDATGQSLGRLASKIAAILNGKSSQDFAKNKVLNIKVEVENVEGIKMTGNKMNEIVHKRFSGYPGGLKEIPVKRVIAKSGMGPVLIHAVKGMLPKNKLQEERLRNLIIKN